MAAELTSLCLYWHILALIVNSADIYLFFAATIFVLYVRMYMCVQLYPWLSMSTEF